MNPYVSSPVGWNDNKKAPVRENKKVFHRDVNTG
jgi:hypothetical protein